MLLESSLTFILALLFILLMKNYAFKLGFIDIPNERSSHIKATPRGAGIGFVLAFLLVSFLFFKELIMLYPLVYSAIFMVFLIGLLDDSFRINPLMKFFVIIGSTILLFFNHITIHTLGLFWGVELQLGSFSLLFTIFAVVGFTNALNLIDGLDGLAALLSLVILTAFAFIGWKYHDTFILTIATLSIAMLVAFLLFNWAPASIFMGDSGSLTVGFIISILAIKSLAYIPTVSVLFIAAVPILDTIIVMVRRKLSKRAILSADKCHMHHIFYHILEKNSVKTVLLLGAIQSLYTLFGLQWSRGINEGYLLLFFIFNTFFFYRLLRWSMKHYQIEC